MEPTNDPNSIHQALWWLVNLFNNHHIPYQVVGGLAAQAYGATRPLVDVDLYIPLSQVQPAWNEMQPYVRRDPLPHRSDSWDLVYLALEHSGVWIEIGDSDQNPRFFNRVDQRWEPQGIDYNASHHVTLYGVGIAVMPKSELIRYKAMLDREVDHLDIAEMSQGSER